MQTLKEKAIKGLFWSTVSQGGKQISQIIITMILARLLLPSDFGLVGMATVFTGIATVFAELGVSSALIQKQDVEEKHFSTAFWLNIATGIVLTLIFIFASPLIAAFYKKPELRLILLVMSLNFTLSSFTIVQQTILTKSLNFRALSIRDLASGIIAGFVGIVLAYLGYGVWSLVFQLLTFTFTNNVFLWTMSDWKPKFIFSASAIKDIFRFSSRMTGFQIINYFARNIDQLLIGKFLGAQALGYYSIAYKILLYPIQNVTAIVNKVMFPVFSKIQADYEKIRKSYIRMIKNIAMITFPTMVIIFTIAHELIIVFFGKKWEPSIILVQILCFAGMIQSVGGPIVGTIRLSQGQTDLHLKIGILNALMAAISIIIGLQWGVFGVAVTYTIFSLVWAVFTNYVTLPLIHLKLDDFFMALKVPGSIAMILLSSLAVIKLFFSFRVGLKLLVVVCLGALIYFFLLNCFKVVQYKKRKLSINV